MHTYNLWLSLWLHKYPIIWIIVFNSEKCNWYSGGNDLIKNPIIKLGDSITKKVESSVHLSMHIGSNEFVEEFFCQKFRNVEKSYYSPYGIGCRPGGMNFAISANIYKKFCQSWFYYGLETN